MIDVIQHVDAVRPGLGTVDSFFNVFLAEALARQKSGRLGADTRAQHQKERI